MSSTWLAPRNGTCGLSPLAVVVLVALAAMPAALVAAESKPAWAEALGREIQDSLSSKCASRGNIGIAVIDLATKDMVYARRPDVTLMPASNMKLYTVAAALHALGPNHRLRTRLGFVGRRQGEHIDGNLVLRGEGDPFLLADDLRDLVIELLAAGISSVGGDVVVDDSYFDHERRGNGWRDQTQKWYNAPIGALSLNFNCVAVHVSPGMRPGVKAIVSTTPELGVDVGGGVATRGPGQRSWFGANRREGTGGRPLVSVNGSVSTGAEELSIIRTITDPPRFAGNVFLELLKDHGITVRGGLKSLDADDLEGSWAQSMAAERVTWLAEHYSPPLAEIAFSLQKHSNNFMAEMALKSLGAVAHGAPGTAAKGAIQVVELLRSKGIDPAGFAMVDGSGLSSLNRVTARQTAELLAAMEADWRVGPEYVAVLPRSGLDGTLHARMTSDDVRGWVRAKTGTISGVSALSGYAGGDGRPAFAFSILVNSLPCGPGAARALQDRIARILVRYADHSTLVAANEPPAVKVPAPRRHKRR
ncbi:MAG: D-alanyl-D-alanine carboxypeptidase/D-alanyl-D-alanine-endopeptidase [Candidatus Schekmanbacteria bacterium]|nr:D-alanyl-D-alanine carboxypeptidase/D-alanyl-D-alanine-endopeptidase [Candidatus Schekmanbacteria bacterium]